MHWFWRALIATITAMVGCSLVQRVPLGPWAYTMDFLLLFNLMSVVVTVVIGATVYGLLTRRHYGKTLGKHETRCRKCGYILRGISEPRCPECGERI